MSELERLKKQRKELMKVVEKSYDTAEWLADQILVDVKIVDAKIRHIESGLV